MSFGAAEKNMDITKDQIHFTISVKRSLSHPGQSCHRGHQTDACVFLKMQFCMLRI